MCIRCIKKYDLMKSQLSKTIFRSVLVFLTGGLLFSCSKTLDIAPEGTLPSSKYYLDVKDANVAVMGIYSQLYDIAEQYVVLNELRADLLDVTNNSGEYLKQINEHSTGISKSNPWADPSKFYSVILNCNDVLINLRRMKNEKKILNIDFWSRYSDVAAVRCWLYMQLGFHFGRVPYITDAYTDVDALKDTLNVNMFTLDQIVNEQIRFLEGIQVESMNPANGGINAMETSYDLLNGSSVDKVFNVFGGKLNEAGPMEYISKRFVMGDLYLWQGNYRNAAIWYKRILDKVPATDKFTYRLSNLLEAPFQANYNAWSNMFVYGSDPNITSLSTEWIWMMYYDKNVKPSPFVDMFGNQPSNKYILKPSSASIEIFNTASATGVSDKRGADQSYVVINGNPLVTKYSLDYVNYSIVRGSALYIVKETEKGGRWFLNRSAQLYLRFAEAANRDNRCRLAWAILNDGIQKNYDIYSKPPLSLYYATNHQDYTNDPKRDHTNTGCTFDIPPYDFNARKGDVPFFDEVYASMQGVRGRGGVANAVMPSYVITKNDSIMNIETLLIEEASLELAYEGHRWEDLVRIAKRRNDPSFLADKIYRKLLLSGNGQAEAVRSRLMSESNWYLPEVSFK